MKIELREFESYPMVKAGDLVICKNEFQFLVGTDGDYFRLITIDEHECYIVKAGDLVICKNEFQFLVGTDGDYFKLISIDEHECEITEEVYTPESLMKELDELGLQRVVRSENLKLIEL